MNILLALFIFAAAYPQDFDELMGKSTPHWDHVSEAKDFETLAIAKALFEKNKKAETSNDGFYKIPPVIHFIWLGPRPFPPESVENVRSWIAQNPGCKVKFWTDRDRDPPCEEMERVLVKDFYFSKLGRCFEESKNWGEKSDILRYEILLREGGIYVDHDAKCLKSIDPMARGYDFFSGLETPHEPFVGRSVTCGNGIIGSRPRHPAVEKVVNLVADRWISLGEKFRGNDPYSRIEIVMQRTYIALTDAMKESLDKEGNVDIVFPAAYFFAKSGIPSLYVKNFFATTWDEFKARKTKGDRFEEKSLERARTKNRNLCFLMMGLIGFNVLLWVIIVAKKRKTA